MARLVTLIAGLLIAAPPGLAAGDPPPNIVLIAVDDMGYDTPASFGGRVAGLTPHIDALASQGISFTRAYNTSSRCAPSRGSIMTGHFQDDAGHGDAAPEPVLFMDFDAVRPGGPADHLLQHEQLSLAPGAGVGGSTGLRAEYEGSDIGSERIVRHVFLPEPGLEFSLNYDVRFDRDFQFVRGGKLLGLGPTDHIAGGRPIVPDGWSARVTFKEGGVARLYTYHQDQPGRYGDRPAIQETVNFERERYHSVSLHVRVNDPPEAANGFSRLYIDGELIERHENLRLRGTGGPSSLINKFMFSSFHGGHMPEWAPRDADGNYATVHATFDNIAVFEGEHVRTAPGH